MFSHSVNALNSNENEVRGSLRLRIPDANFFLNYIDKASIMDILTFNVYGKRGLIELRDAITIDAESKHAQIMVKYEHGTTLLKNDIRKLEEELTGTLDKLKEEKEKRDDMSELVLAKVEIIEELTDALEISNEMIEKLKDENAKLKKKIYEDSKTVIKVKPSKSDTTIIPSKNTVNPKPKKKGVRKLMDKEVIAIRKELNKDKSKRMSSEKLAAKYNISLGTLSRIANRVTYKNI